MSEERLKVEMITGDTPLTFDPGITWVLGKMNRVEELEAQLQEALEIIRISCQMWSNLVGDCWDKEQAAKEQEWLDRVEAFLDKHA